jgi:hypothetical protein
VYGRVGFSRALHLLTQKLSDIFQLFIVLLNGGFSTNNLAFIPVFKTDGGINLFSTQY